MHGMEADSTRHGAPSWFEAVSTDVARATDFYCDLFGWSASVHTGAPFAYTTFALDGTPVAGMASIDDLPPHDVAVRSHLGHLFHGNRRCGNRIESRGAWREQFGTTDDDSRWCTDRRIRIAARCAVLRDAIRALNSASCHTSPGATVREVTVVVVLVI